MRSVSSLSRLLLCPRGPASSTVGPWLAAVLLASAFGMAACSDSPTSSTLTQADVGGTGVDGAGVDGVGADGAHLDTAA